MAEALVERSLDWLSDFGDFVSDAGAALPFDLDAKPRRESAKGIHDVAEIVRNYQLSWLGEAPNHATPLELRELLIKLDRLTAQIEAQIDDHEETTALRVAKLGLMGVGIWTFVDKSNRGEQRALSQVATDLQRWRARLDDYTARVEALIPKREQDRSAVLWEVTAPLFLGWYGGPTGSEVPLVGQPETFNPKTQHLADIGSPYRIANELGVWLDWHDERKDLLYKDFKDGAEDKANVFAWAAGAAVVGAGLGVGATYAFRRKRT